MRIRKNDLKDDYILTYLFDAKYRLHSDEKEGAPDTPPPDALNQMHRYRDAIYYMDRKADGARPEKEVVGGYILFPGEGGPEQVKQQPYYQAIEQVNIGAFPLRPGDEAQRALLRGHVEHIIKRSTGHILSDVRPQKHMRYNAIDPFVLVSVSRDRVQEEYLMSNAAEFYHFGLLKPKWFAHERLRYFAPYIKEKGVSCYFEILGIELKARNTIYPAGHVLHRANDTTERLVLRLGKRITILDGKYFKPEKTFTTFRYTLLSALRAPRDGKVELILSEDLDAGEV